jgi:hypothetical protein
VNSLADDSDLATDDPDLQQEPIEPVTPPYMPEVKRQCCGNCNAFFRTAPSEGICRAMPPSPVLIGMGRPAIELGPMGGVPQPVINGFFPPVAHHIWCRFWQAAIGNTGGN